MRQLTLATVGFDKHRKQTRRAVFLAEMDRVMPWRALCAEIEPFYPKRGKNRTKSSVRAKVEHPFLVIKRVFGFVRVRYRGLASYVQPGRRSSRRSQRMLGYSEVPQVSPYLV